MRSLILIISLLFAGSLSAETLDSLGIKRVGDKDFIEHKVDKGQTLYSLARRYGVSVAEINEQNPELATGLRVGQILLIPVKKKADAAANTTKPAEKKPVEKPAPSIIVVEMDTNKYIYHEVAAEESLAKIGRMYKVSISQIRQWNKLNTDAVSPGQMLIVGLKPKPKADPKKGKPAPAKVDEGTETREQGQAVLLNDPLIDQQRNFCYHPTAAVGTIIMVTNPANNQSVFVRVQGNYAADGSTVIKLSQAAIKKLGGNASGFEVSLNYAR